MVCLGNPQRLFTENCNRVIVLVFILQPFWKNVWAGSVFSKHWTLFPLLSCFPLVEQTRKQKITIKKHKTSDCLFVWRVFFKSNFRLSRKARKTQKPGSSERFNLFTLLPNYCFSSPWNWLWKVFCWLHWNQFVIGKRRANRLQML